MDSSGGPPPSSGRDVGDAMKDPAVLQQAMKMMQNPMVMQQMKVINRRLKVLNRLSVPRHLDMNAVGSVHEA